MLIAYGFAFMLQKNFCPFWSSKILRYYYHIGIVVVGFSDSDLVLIYILEISVFYNCSCFSKKDAGDADLDLVYQSN